MKKLNSGGFTLVEGLLIIIALAIIGGVGFYVVNANKDKKDNTKASGARTIQTEAKRPEEKDPYQGWQTYTDTELGYTLKYPADWVYTAKKEISKNYKGEPIYEPASFAPKGKTEPGDPHIYIEQGPTTYKDAESYWNNEGSGRAGEIVGSKAETINGYSRFYVSTKMQGELFTYAIVNNGKAINLNAQLFGDNSLLDIHTKIANSIKFN